MGSTQTGQSTVKKAKDIPEIMMERNHRLVHRAYQTTGPHWSSNMKGSGRNILQENMESLVSYVFDSYEKFVYSVKEFEKQFMIYP